MKNKTSFVILLDFVIDKKKNITEKAMRMN